MLSEESEKYELNSSSRRLLRDIEHVSKCLNLHRTSFDNGSAPIQRSKSNIITGKLLHEDKKPSIWKKSWKALQHFRNRRFDCWFFLHVHSIEGLPSEFNDTHIRVHWKKKHNDLRTRPAKVSQGKAQYEETLMHRCSVYGSKTHHKCKKYDPKVFLLYALVEEATVVDMGKYQIDLTKLLPLTLEELGRARSSGKWSSNFKLCGRAKGGVLNVSFGFSLRPESLLELGNSSLIPMLLRDIKSNVRVDSVDGSNSKRYLLRQSQSSDSNIVSEEVSKSESERAGSTCVVYENVDEANMGRSHESPCEDVAKGCIDTNISISKQGIEKPSKVLLVLGDADQSSRPERIDVTEIFGEDGIDHCEDEGCDLKDENFPDNKNHNAIGDAKLEQDGEIDCDGWTGFNSMGEDYCNNNDQILMFESPNVEIIDVKDIFKDEEISVDGEVMLNSTEENYCYNEELAIERINLDDITDSIANDFLKSLTIEQNPFDLDTDSDPESPRELLLRQFQVSGGLILNLDSEEENIGIVGGDLL